MSVYAKLLEIQTQLKAPKSQYNDFGNYNYRNCEDILEAVKPLCKEQHAVVYLTDKLELVGDRYYIKAKAIFVDIETGESIEVEAFAREELSKKGMDGSQVTGASSSYARKYALNGLFDIDDTKDSDTTNEATRKPPVCEACGAAIKGIIHDGNKLTAEEVAAKIKETHGKVICSKCQKQPTAH